MEINVDFSVYLDKSWKFTSHVLILIILGIIAIAGFLILAQNLNEVQFVTPELPPPLPSIPKTTEEVLKPGEIGELPEGETPELPPGIPGLASVTFSTSGEIAEVKENQLIVAGSGSNFADKKARVLTILFTSSTITFEPKQKIKYRGLDGLNHLSPGTIILIGAEENIRGKTEFLARTINIR